jgi:hypothetical protein
VSDQRDGIAELRRAFEQARGDVAVLGRLSNQLKSRSDDAALVLHGEVAAALIQARKLTPVSPSHPIERILAERGLRRSDGRPLYKYRVSAEEWCALRTHLSSRCRARVLTGEDRRDGGAFALFASEWFRREFEGGMYRWEDLLAQVGPLSQALVAELAREGLRFWGRTTRRTDSGEQRLMSLALEGGFPTRLLESRQRGWLSETVRRLIARVSLFDELDIEAATELASAEVAIPYSFRSDQFFALLAELACSIADIRRRASPLAAAAGLPTSVWLDANEDGWRDELPIGLEGQSAAHIIDELVSQSLARLSGAGARCWRLLIKTDNAWAPGLRVAFDGPVTPPRQARDHTTRLRVHAAGDLADRITGELALLDPPGDEGEWLVRPRPAAPQRPLRDYPLSKAALVELRAEGHPLTTVAWSSAGEPVRGEVLAFVDELGGAEDVAELTLVGAGSRTVRQAVVYVWCPSDHVARTMQDVAIEPWWKGDEHNLYRLDCEALVGRVDEVALFYRPGAGTERPECFELQGEVERRLLSPYGREIFIGKPSIQLRRGISTVQPGFGECCWRYAGEKSWRDIRREPLGVGELEVIWRSDDSRAARDRRRFIVLPPILKVRCRALRPGQAEFTLESASGWSLSCRSAEFAQEEISSGFRARWNGRRSSRIRLSLKAPDGRSIELETAFPLGDGALVAPEGVLFPDHATVTLRQLIGARAIRNGVGRLVVEPLPRANRRLYQQHDFRDEVSLWSLRDQVDAFMEASDDLDAEVSIGFEPSGPCIRARRYAHELVVSRDTVRLQEQSTAFTGELEVRRRSLLDTSDTGLRTIGRWSVADAMSRKTLRLPADLAGPGVVFLCEDGVVASRACFAMGQAAISGPLLPLQQAQMHEPQALAGAIKEAFEALEAGQDTDAQLKWLHSFIEANAALPAVTFELLKGLGKRSRSLAMLVAATPSEEALQRLWALEPQLPFIWVLVGVEDWRHAFHRQQDRVAATLMAAGWDEGRARATAADNAAVGAARMIALDELLAEPLRLAGVSNGPPRELRSAALVAQDFVRRSSAAPSQAVQESMFLADALIGPELRKLRNWYEDFSAEHWEGLQAPLVAALRAAGRVKLAGQHRLRIRGGILADPEHFGEAYSGALRQLLT